MHGEAGNCRELMQYTADVVHPKAKSAGAVQWAHSSVSRIPCPRGLPVRRPRPRHLGRSPCRVLLRAQNVADSDAEAVVEFETNSVIRSNVPARVQVNLSPKAPAKERCGVGEPELAVLDDPGSD